MGGLPGAGGGAPGLGEDDESRDPKRQKTDEPRPVPEAAFLAQHPVSSLPRASPGASLPCSSTPLPPHPPSLKAQYCTDKYSTVLFSLCCCSCELPVLLLLVAGPRAHSQWALPTVEGEAGLQGQTVDVTVSSLGETTGALKEVIAQQGGAPGQQAEAEWQGWVLQGQCDAGAVQLAGPGIL